MSTKMDEMRDVIGGYTKLLQVERSVSSQIAEQRAGEFLVIMAFIAEWKYDISEDKIKNESVTAAVYAGELSKCTSTKVTENKIQAEASKAYLDAREASEGSDSILSYLRTYYEIFNNAHLFYRQMAKGDNQ